MKKIKLNKGYYTLIDDEDYSRFKDLKLHLRKSRNTLNAAILINGKKVFIHRIIMNCPDNMYVDHKNHNGLDNRRSNLRICTNKQNIMNSKKFKIGSSEYKGVSWQKNRRKWHSYIHYNYKKIHLGSFDNEKKAALAYNNAAKKYFGEYAYLNEIK